MPTKYLLAQGDSLVYQFQPSRNYSSHTHMSAGRDTNGSLGYMLICFKTLNSLPPGAVLTGASLLLTVISTLSTTTPSPEYAVLRVLSRWRPSSVTWENQPAYDPAPQASFTSPALGVLSLSLTPLVQSWLTGSAADLGLLIMGVTGFNSGTFFQAATINTSDSDRWPRLRLDYALPTCVVSPEFVNTHSNLNVPSAGSVNEVQDVSLLGLVTVSITNNGPDSIEAHLEISADGINYVQNGSTQRIANGDIANLLADIFARFLRLKVTDNGVNGANIDVYFQGQIG